jgi:hypothetical protein
MNCQPGTLQLISQKETNRYLIRVAFAGKVVETSNNIVIENNITRME